MSNFLMIKKTLLSKSGFTLVETIVAVSIFTILMFGITLMMKNIIVNGRQDALTINNVDGARRVGSIFTNELRNGAYGANGAYPIGQASSTQIIFYSTSPKGDGTVSKVRYYISGKTLYKGVTSPGGSPLGYNGREATTTLITAMSLGSSPLFNYYDGNYSGTSTPLTQPVNINQVKFVRLNLIVSKQIFQNATSTFQVSAGSTIRNLKTNLGN